MATTSNQEVVINFVVNDEELDASIKKLEDAGKVDAKTANNFKQTNAELNKEAQALDKVATAFQKVNNAFKNVDKSAIIAGINDALEETGATATEFVKLMEEAGVSMDDLSEAVDHVVQEFDVFIQDVVEAEKETGDFEKALDKAKEKSKHFDTSLKGATLSVSNLRDAVRATGAPFKTFADSQKKWGDEAPKVAEKQETLRKKLREVTVELQNLQAAGLQNSERYIELVALAGEYGDAIDEVNNQIKNSRDGEKTINQLVAAAQQLTQAMAGAQAAASLLGDDSEEMQATFAKLGLVLQVVAGLQALITGLQSDGVITLAILNIQLKIHNAQLAIENGLQSRNVIVKWAAVAAQKALNIAIGANPIGLIITLLVTVIPLMLAYANNTREAAAAQAALNNQLDRTGESLDEALRGIQNAGTRIEGELAASGARQSEILAQQIATERQLQLERQRQWEENAAAIRNAREEDRTSEDYLKLIEQQTALERQIDDGNTQGYVRNLELLKQKRIEALEDNINNINTQLMQAEEGSRRQLQLQIQLSNAQRALEIENAGKNLALIRQINERVRREQIEMEIEFNRRRLELEKQNLETRLINIQDDLEQELTIRTQILQKQTALELANTKLSEAEKKAIRKAGFEALIALQRDFDRRIRERVIANEQSRIQAELQQRELGEQEKLDLTIASIELTAAAEVIAAEGNAAKIKEIYARRDKSIRDFRLQMLNEMIEYEISLQTARDGVDRRALQRIAANEQKSKQERIDALNEVTAKEIENIDLRLRGLDRAREQGLISERDYTLQYEQLSDRRKELEEQNIISIRELRKQSLIQTAEMTITMLTQIAGVVQAIQESEQQRLQAINDRRRRELEELKESGAITEREAERRERVLQERERQAKNRAAQQQKQAAVFQALLAIPQAFLTGLTQGGIVVAAIYAALAATQAAVIASRQPPKFFKGKKDRYAGWGIVGDGGTEYVSTKSGGFYADKPTYVYLNPDDKVYTANETRLMMNKTKLPKPNRFDSVTTTNYEPVKIDYDKLGNVIAKNQNQTHINISTDFVEKSVQNGMLRVMYMDKRYKI